MLEIFTWLASWLVYDLGGFDPDSKLGSSLHFFVEDTSKIFALLVVMIYIIALLRASLNLERVRYYIQQKNRFAGYGLGAGFGAITPFCSCSSIPLFLGFTSAGIPLGITMAFLFTSPIINEVAVIMLWSLLGWEFTLVYITIGMAVGIGGGMLLDSLGAERWLKDFAAKAYQNAAGSPQANQPAPVSHSLTFKQRHQFARNELYEIVARIWKWIIIGVGLGAALHGFVPDGWFSDNLGSGQWWNVPVAVLAGLPLYSNATGVIPIMESLITKGLPVGTTLAFCMSTVAASFPEFIMLKQVMLWRLLATIFIILLINFMLVGWIINLLAPWIFSSL
ncbi:permease [Halomonas sp. ISL-60]|uniref:permease n=1 Tax=Halomonas sp. ISL-56 TaxID=2819149 RepID=UPI001BE75975|nr:permease [Halomonas sp. ISL-56]MBT2770780.1 permease [Halomonas sp. ISL-60]MBT2803856.1 permease [Halomonas sp. ISL-56]